MKRQELTDDDIMLRIGLINRFHQDPKKKYALIAKLLNELPRSKRLGLYFILSSKNMAAVIQHAIDGYPLELLDGKEK